MKSKKPQKRTRVLNLYLTPQMVQRIDELTEQMDYPSRSECIRQTLKEAVDAKLEKRAAENVTS